MQVTLDKYSLNKPVFFSLLKLHYSLLVFFGGVCFWLHLTWSRSWWRCIGWWWCWISTWCRLWISTWRRLWISTWCRLWISLCIPLWVPLRGWWISRWMTHPWLHHGCLLYLLDGLLLNINIHHSGLSETQINRT